MTDENKKKLIKWLNTQVKYVSDCELVMVSEHFRIANLSVFEKAVHLNSNINEIAEILDIEVFEESFNEESVERYFMYKGIKFFAIYSKEEV